MKKLIIVWFSFFLLTAVSAQISDKAFAAVKYHFTHITDTTQPNDPYTETMVLLLGKDHSAYQSYDKMVRDSIFTAQAEEQMRMGSRNITIGSPGMKAVNRNIIYKNNASGKQSRLENMLGYYLIDEPVSELNWSIEPETRNFKDLVCQKATTYFKGRNYTAWFCAQLPYSNGPWKLGGLPGLILEAYDDKKEVIFAFESFEDVTPRNMVIKTPSNATKATQAEFVQLQEAFKKDPQGFMKTRMAGSGVSVGNVSLGAVSSSMPMSINVTTSGAGSKKKEINNPIEKEQ